MSLITASTVRTQTMADGSLRLTVDIEPAHAVDAFTLFHAPGSPLVIGRLTPEAAQESAQQAAVEPQEERKGGPLARLAGIWCADPGFRAWLAEADGHASYDIGEAAAAIRATCGIDSRAELDHNPRARTLFDQHFRIPYNRYLQGE